MNGPKLIKILMPYVYFRPYIYSFWQIFQVLPLFPVLSLSRVIRKNEPCKFFFLILGKFIQKEICASVSSKWALKRHLRSCHTPQDLEEFEIISGKGSGNGNLRATPDPNPDLEVWQNGLWSSQLGDTKFDRFLAKNKQV